MSYQRSFQNMAPIDLDEHVPGTEYLVDVEHTLEVTHAGAGKSDVVLLPQPTQCGSDPLSWTASKKYYQLFLLALYACAFSYGENTLGAAWTTVSEDTGVSIQYMNAGSALNYLLLGFVNIFWIPAAMKIGRRPVFLATTLICLGAAVWIGYFQGVAQWMLAMILNGVGTSAYQAVIQLSVFDMFFVHQRGRGLSFYLFGQQLGSILGLITGGSIADNLSWRWSQYIVAIIEGGVLILFIFTFEETLFPRFLFPEEDGSSSVQSAAATECSKPTARSPSDIKTVAEVETPPTDDTASDVEVGLTHPDFPERTWLQKLKPWVYYRQDHTSYWTYFVRPFFLLAFPNVVIVSGSETCISKPTDSPPRQASSSHSGVQQA